MTESRRRRHHVVPRLHLRGFGSADGRLEQVDVSTGRRRPVSVNDAAVIRDFYTVTLPDGSRTDAWERWLSELENDVAPALRRAVSMGRFLLTEDDRLRLARWVALQYLRGPDNRRMLQEHRSLMLRMQVGMGGIAYLQHVMSAAEGRLLDLSEVQPVWDDITSGDGPAMTVNGDEHLRHLSRIFDEAVALVHARSWARVRFERNKLVVSDAPVSLLRGDTPDWHGVGLANAPVVTVPLDRKTLLWLDLANGGAAQTDRELPASTRLAQMQNLAAALSAERFVYFHADDAPLPPGAVPRPRLPRVQVSGIEEFANRDRPLRDVLDQIDAAGRNPGEVLIADYSWPIPGYLPPAS